MTDLTLLTIPETVFVSVEGMDYIHHVEYRYLDHVVVNVGCFDQLPMGVDLVLPYDIDGQGLARVPHTMIRNCYTEDQANAYWACKDADERLLSYAL